jgi:hypothetical protein
VYFDKSLLAQVITEEVGDPSLNLEDGLICLRLNAI